MKKLLITGGTVFVSKFTANYFANKNYEVYVLNRNTKEQLDNVHLICADRNALGDVLKPYHFDAVIDVCGYNEKDVRNLIAAMNPVQDYIFISTSAVYPAANTQPFTEEQPATGNPLWGTYGSDKYEAEQYIFSHYPNAYAIRPPYLYGPMNDIYRETFVFDCALQDRKFYIPKDGKMKLQFFHVEDLCKLMEFILENHPKDHIYNVGNKDVVDINTFVELCYKVAGTPLEKVNVTTGETQRDYFSFGDYEYVLDVTRQTKVLSETKDFETGLRESFNWYINHPEDVEKRDYMDFIDKFLAK